MRPLSKFWLVGLLAIIIATVGFAFLTRRRVLKFDFATSRLATQISPASGAAWDSNSISFKDQRVDVCLPEGHVFRGRVMELAFRRFRDQVILIDLELGDMTIEDAYTTATEFAKQWSLPTAKLDKWRSAVGAGVWDREWVQILDNSRSPNIALDIVNSYDPTGVKPVRVSFALSWPLESPESP